MEQIDWNFVIKLVISSGVGLALLKWAAPILLRQVIKDTIQEDVLDVLEDHNDRVGKNELSIQTHSLQMAKMTSAINSLERDREMIREIHTDVKKMIEDFGSVKISVAVLQDRWDGIDRRNNA